MRFRPALPLLLTAGLLGGPLSGSTARAAPSGADIEKAATRVAEALGGVLRNCPTSFAAIGTDGKRCVGASGTVETVRLALAAALEGDLYSVWRSRDEQRSVYNWVQSGGGYVYLRLQADPDGRAETLVYLDAPPDSTLPGSTGNAPSAPSMQVGSVTLTPAQPTTQPTTQPATPPTSQAAATQTSAAQTSMPQSPAAQAPAAQPTTAQTPTPPTTVQPAGQTPTASTASPGASSAELPQRQPPAASPPPSGTPAPATAKPAPPKPAVTARSLAPVPFTRTLRLQTPRMSGQDIQAAQNRLIGLMRPARTGRGDGWFGPVTQAAVKAFQTANGLPASGQINRATWDVLFSPGAKAFAAAQ